jgi:hypothetical protein
VNFSNSRIRNERRAICLGRLRHSKLLAFRIDLDQGFMARFQQSRALQNKRRVCMITKSEAVERKAAPSRRMARRILQEEAYRRIMTGDMSETLSEFAAQLSAWLREAHPTAAPMPGPLVEDAIRDTWHRRHEMIGSEL